MEIRRNCIHICCLYRCQLSRWTRDLSHYPVRLLPDDVSHSVVESSYCNVHVSFTKLMSQPSTMHAFLSNRSLDSTFNIYVVYITSPHLSSSGPVEVHLLQLALSTATGLASFQQFHPSTRLSFSIVDATWSLVDEAFFYFRASRSMVSQR